MKEKFFNLNCYTKIFIMMFLLTGTLSIYGQLKVESITVKATQFSSLGEGTLLTSTLGHPKSFSKNFHQIKKLLIYVFRLRALSWSMFYYF